MGVLLTLSPKAREMITTAGFLGLRLTIKAGLRPCMVQSQSTAAPIRGERGSSNNG